MTRIGIIGLGFMGRMHFDTYAKLAGAEVIAICDADPKRASGDLSGGWGNIAGATTQQLPMDRITGVTNPDELLGNPDISVIDICLPTPVHPEIVIAALAAGKNVICEKPLALTSTDARRIADAAASARGIFMPAMCMRFWPEWEWLKRSVDSGTYGKVKSAVFRRLTTLPKGWFRDGKLSGGALLDLHIHDTDFVYHLFGRPASVFSRGYRGDTGEIDHVVTQYLYDGDHRDTLITAEGGWTHAEGFGFKMQYLVNFETATADFDIGRKPALLLHSEGISEPVATSGSDGYAGELAYFLECVRTGKKLRRVTVADAVQGLLIIEAERKSIESRQPIVV